MNLAFLFLILAGSPDILAIGDSITHGWAEYTSWACPRDNCRSTVYTLTHLHEWQGGKHWRTIVFNCGLHDIREGVPVAEYKSNLRAIISRLRPRTDRLYFCNTTPGRKHEWRGWEPEKIDAYNEAALEVMRTEHVPVIDLYGPAMAHREWWKEDVHYTPQGYAQMAKIVADAIQK
jgi:lysophospholipase L1-like esterase